jgi:hypothetical protein
MANDCDYKVRITGEVEDLRRLHKALECDEIEDKNSLHSENYSLLFESCDDVEDWGSKWTVFSTIDYSDGDTMMFIEGYSAWSPTEGLWQKISKDYSVSLECEYSEKGCDIAGIISWHDGDESERVETTYFRNLFERDLEYFWEEIGYQCEWDSLDGLKESLGEVWDDLTDDEKEKLEQLHQERYEA